MKLTQVLALVAALAAIVAAYFGYEDYKRNKVSLPVRPNNVGGFGAHFGNSPIVASGGSMTFRITGPGNLWSCDTTSPPLHQQCVSSVPVSTGDIACNDVISPDGSQANCWSTVSKAWSLEFRVRDNPQNGGVKMCTISSMTSTKCDAELNSVPSYTSAYILMQIVGASVQTGQTPGKVALMYSSAIDSGQAIQYYDSGCDIHDPTHSPIPACEHPGTIKNSIDNVINKCRHGMCQVALVQ
ncbi:MAG: hypothetical protein JOZ32_12815 [Bryobacterales bacterium]|nr:hypothetical protein [Bryobacterales bacterium]